MVDYADSSQLNLWLYESPEQLSVCRSKANYRAREYLSQRSSSTEESTAAAPSKPLPIECFACGFRRNVKAGDEKEQDYTKDGPLEDEKGNPFLTPEEEALLVSFYVSKLPSLIGPLAQVPRLRRESKVTATSAMLLRRFFLSNSVMLYDPKAIMTAAAFLGSKVEDATADVRHLEEGTALMNAPVTQQEIIPSEISLLGGTHFDLLCFHPYKTVLALTEDLRTFLKSDKGKHLVDADRHLSGQDLKPIYDSARALLDDVVVSDLVLLYNPGHVGLAALMVAQERVHRDANVDPKPPRIDLEGYILQRFDDNGETNQSLIETLRKLFERMDALKTGMYGCGNYGVDMNELKAIHKKLKKVKVWGLKKKKKKEGEPEAKRQKTS